MLRRPGFHTRHPGANAGGIGIPAHLLKKCIIATIGLKVDTLLRLAFPYIEAGLIISAPAGVVWNLLVDTSRWAEWGPSVRSVECSDPVLAPLSSGRVKTALGFALPFAVTHFEQGRVWSWSVCGIPATTHSVEGLGKDRCRLLFGVPMPAFLYLFICLIAIRRIAALTKAVRDPASVS